MIYKYYGCINIEEVHITDLAAWCGIKFDTWWGNPGGSHLYLNGEEIIDLVIPDGVTSIGNCAFQSLSNLTSVSIPNSVTSIGEYAFSSCKNLTSLTIPSSVTNINKFAFTDCSGLTTLTLSEGLTTIGRGAFLRCSGLTSIEIPSSVTSIEDYAFKNCTSLSNVTSLIQVPFAIVGVFSDDVYENATLYVPFGTKESYMNTEGWNNFYNIVTIGGVQIAINETNFPDGNFRNYLLAQSYGLDGMLTDNEMEVTVVNVNNKGINSLKGIEHFTELKELYCSGNQLAALDLSGNVVLTKLDCSSNQLTALDVSENTSLTELECYSNQIKGTAMDALISSLPDKTGEYTDFRIIYNDEETIEGNACTKEQVAAAIAKGWEPMEYKDEEWVPYEGSDVTVQINTATISRGLQPVYTLSGQRVTAPKKGINIVGGKKVVVK